MVKKIYLCIIVSISIGASENYFDNLSDEVVLTIFSSVLHEQDFNKALHNLANLPIVNKRFDRLLKDKAFRKEIISLALQGDLNAIIQKLDTLYANKKFKNLTEDKKFTQWLVEKVLPSKLVNTITSLSCSQLLNENDLKVLSVLLLGTPLAFTYISTNDLKKLITNLVPSLMYISSSDWKDNAYLYKKIARSLRTFISPNENQNLYYNFIHYAIKYYDLDMLKLLFKDTNNLDITNPIRVAFAYLDCNKSYDAIKTLLEFSNNFEAEIIDEFHQYIDFKKIVDSRCTETINMLNQVLEAKKNTSKKMKLS